MGTRRDALATLGTLAGLWLLAAQAQAWTTSDTERQTAPFWQEVSRPGTTRAESLTRQATAQLDAARQHPAGWETICLRTRALAREADTPAAQAGRLRALEQLMQHALRRRGFLDNALVRLEKAHALSPKDPEVLYLLASVLASWEEPGPLWSCEVRRRNQDAIEALRRLIQRHPEHEASQVSFELGILLTRHGEFGQAADAYRRAINLSLDSADTGVMRANLAEVTMLAGDLEGAVAHYKLAISLSRGGRDLLLALWGLTVALDRLGEHEAALKHARDALRAARGGQMRVLRSDNVFFEPRHEIHYYEALGHEALAKGEQRRPMLEKSAASWRRYVAESPPDDPWRKVAQQHAERVEGLFAARPKRSVTKPKRKAAPKPPNNAPAPIWRGGSSTSE